MITETKANRNKIITKLVNRGLTLRQVAEIFKLSLTRVAEIERNYNTEKIEGSDTHCVNCEISAHGKFDKKKFFFKNETVNLCVNCLIDLRKIKD